MARDIVDDRLVDAVHVRALTRRAYARDASAAHTASQVGTLDALMAGHYDGDVTIGEVLEHGDLGLGTVQGLGGELVVVDGEAFVVDADGAVHAVPPQTRTPFAVVCRFAPVVRTQVSGPLDLAGLHAALTDHAPDEPVLAVRVDGSFERLRLRSVRAQRRPYPPLREVTAHQTEWTVPAATGSLVGFRFPDAVAGLEVPGFHLHFLADDRTSGGHVLDATLLTGAAAVDGTADLHVELPPGVGLGSPGTTDREGIRRVEGPRRSPGSDPPDP